MDASDPERWEARRQRAGLVEPASQGEEATFCHLIPTNYLSLCESVVWRSSSPSWQRAARLRGRSGDAPGTSRAAAEAPTWCPALSRASIHPPQNTRARFSSSKHLKSLRSVWISLSVLFVVCFFFLSRRDDVVSERCPLWRDVWVNLCGQLEPKFRSEGY